DGVCVALFGLLGPSFSREDYAQIIQRLEIGSFLQNSFEMLDGSLIPATAKLRNAQIIIGIVILRTQAQSGLKFGHGLLDFSLMIQRAAQIVVRQRTIRHYPEHVAEKRRAVLPVLQLSAGEQ